MTRRTTAASKRDDDAFPIRIKIAVPDDGLGLVIDKMEAWLRENVEAGAYARHGARAVGTFATAYYFVRIEDAAAFLAAVPEARLADGTGKLRRY